MERSSQSSTMPASKVLLTVPFNLATFMLPASLTAAEVTNSLAGEPTVEQVTFTSKCEHTYYPQHVANKVLQNLHANKTRCHGQSPRTPTMAIYMRVVVPSALTTSHASTILDMFGQYCTYLHMHMFMSRSSLTINQDIRPELQIHC